MLSDTNHVKQYLFSCMEKKIQFLAFAKSRNLFSNHRKWPRPKSPSVKITWVQNDPWPEKNTPNIQRYLQIACCSMH